jgi:hypothetical protein
MKNRRVFAFDHFGAQFDFHRAAVAGIGDKMPDGGRAGFKRREIFEIQRREKAVGVDPDADAFDKTWRSTGKSRIQVRAEDAIVFGIHAAQIHAHARHAAAAVGQQTRSECGVRSAECGVGGRKRIAAETFARSGGGVPKSIQLPPPFRAARNRRCGRRQREWIGRESRPHFHSALRIPHSAFAAWRGTARCPESAASGRRNKRDAAAVKQRPFHHARERFFPFRFAQQIGERGFGVARGEFAGGGEEIFAGERSTCSASQRQSRPSMVSAGMILFSDSSAHAAWARARR